MNSLEIAEIVGKRHDNVKRDILAKVTAPKLITHMSTENKKIMIYELSETQMSMLPYSNMILKELDRKQLLKRVTNLEQEVIQLKIDIKELSDNSDIFISMLKKENNELKERNEHLEKLI